ncbi:ring finger ubiquitin ligase [Lasallia pustulata]|uniref:RING-type E3 ubiquitin transferase n=1 Tax=Lasallia pustulata TaxID=136370 RepID=A0A1W5D753_9LECA|nr:ring finger ubiquitin ligase [Lasallia pustulata]
MDAPRVVLLVLLLIFLFLSPDTQPATPSQKREVDALIFEERQAISLLNRSRYGDLDPVNQHWLNLTGFRQDDGYRWDLLPKVQERAREQLWIRLGPQGYLKLEGGVNERLREKINGTPAEANIQTNGSWINNLRGSPPQVYHNVTGIVKGQWIRSAIDNGRINPMLNLAALAPRVPYIAREYSRNVTGHGGDMRLKLDEKTSELLATEYGLVREIRAEMTIKDETSSGDGWEMALHGVHYPDIGGIVLSTTGEKFPGIFALPHFMLSEHTFSLAQRLLALTLPVTVDKQEASLYSSYTYPWSSSPNNPNEMTFPIPHCEYIVYLQQHPAEIGDNSWLESEESPNSLGRIEDELRFPTGAPLPRVPALEMTALIFSPDCGFVLESKGPPEYTPQDGTHLTGPKLESYMRLARHWILMFAIILSLELYLLIRQMKDTSTPSTRSRVSFYTIAIMAMGDGFACTSFIVVSMFIDAAFVALVATAFLAFLCVSFFGMKFLMDIWIEQFPERQERQRHAAAANPPQTPAGPSPLAVITAASADTLPLPVTARRPADTGATPIILPPDQDLDAADAADTAAAQPANPTTLGSARREMGALYTRFYVLLFLIIFLSLHATSWPTTLRSWYNNLLTLLYLSFWLPQIYRNILRNCRKALRWEFVLGQSLLRLTPFIYFYTVSDNVLFVEPDRNAAYLLVAWVWIQAWALVSQEVLGPRFFVPRGWAPPAYDYHPILREDDEEAGKAMVVGFTQATSTDAGAASSSSASAASPRGGGGESKDIGKRTFDCAICMQDIEVPVVPAGGVVWKEIVYGYAV